MASIRVEIDGDKGTAFGPFPITFITTLGGLSGRKDWRGLRSVSFVASGHNIKRLRDSSFEIEWEDRTGKIAAMDQLKQMETQHDTVTALYTDYQSKNPPRDYQKKAIDLSAFRVAYGYFFEMGLGKSYIVIANAGILYLAKKIAGVLILSPRGVHEQWIESEIPKHIDPDVVWRGLVWNKKTFHDWEMKLGPKHCLTFLSMNIDAIRTPKGLETAKRFLKLHTGKCMTVIDESHQVKEDNSQRTKAAYELRDLSTYRRICTGTPIAKNLMDMWAQFNFLNPDIIGIDTKVAFKSRFCLTSANNRQIIGSLNEEEFYSLIAPHSFRMTKEEALDLPPKIYVDRPYHMDDATRKHYNNIKTMFLTQLKNGDIVDAPNAAVALLRLQQIVCGYLTDDEGVVEVISDQRIEECLEITRQTEGPTIIWARFTQDIERLRKALEHEYGSGTCVEYTGRTSNSDRSIAKSTFLDGKARFFLSNPAAGGTGTNLQGDCGTVIYFSNSFNAINRWQSEDRTHRMGMKRSVTYFDLMARGSVDQRIKTNLRNKKSISDLTLDQIRMLVEEG